MALTAQLVNPSYGYQAGGNVSISATLEVKEGELTVGTLGLSCCTSFLTEGWKERVSDSFKLQADEYIAQFKYMMLIVQSVYPTAATPEEAVVLLVDEIESTITI